MTIIDKHLLAEFSARQSCAWCGVRVPRAEAHHVYKRGHGAGRRLDVRVNLIPLGGSFACGCHVKADQSKITRRDLLVQIGIRECCRWDDIEPVIHMLHALPKRPTPAEIACAFKRFGLVDTARRLAERTLDQHSISWRE